MNHLHKPFPLKITTIMKKKNMCEKKCFHRLRHIGLVGRNPDFVLLHVNNKATGQADKRIAYSLSEKHDIEACFIHNCNILDSLCSLTG